MYIYTHIHSCQEIDIPSIITELGFDIQEAYLYNYLLSLDISMSALGSPKLCATIINSSTLIRDYVSQTGHLPFIY